MSWSTVLEEGLERTEVLELARRGCLVKISIRGAAEGDGWTPVALTWCPGLKSVDFLTKPSETANGDTDEKPRTNAAPSPSDDPDAPDLASLAREYAGLQAAVLGAFRAKMGRLSGKLGFLDHVPQVGGFSVTGHGDWVWRIDHNSASLTSKRRVIEVPLPDHTRDDAFSAERLTLYLSAQGYRNVSTPAGIFPVESSIIELQLKEIAERGGALKLFRSQPTPFYVTA